jgi:tRNA-specific 2-thiouridylase
VLDEHLQFPEGRGHVPLESFSGVAGGAVCGDLIRIDLAVDGERVSDAGFEASGCGAAEAAGSAVVALVRGAPLLDAARVSAHTISEELGGLSPGKFHAADLAADALHSALGAAARSRAALPGDPDRVLVAMSGGVDSAVAALRSGSGAVAVTLELWRDPENDAEASCCSASAVRRARALAHGMGLPHFTLDLREEFRAGVVQPFIDSHAMGETPNPCVRCNGFVRLGAMVEFADRLGAGGGLATGHYARIGADGRLREAADPAKDQAYMLAALDQETLGRLRFPLGALTKPEVRALAAEAGLPVANRADSQDLCFLAGIGKAAFLAREIEDVHGPLVFRGETVGRHGGAHHFTVGQRKGLGIAHEEPLFVLRTEGDEVHVGLRDDLRTDRVALRDVVVDGEPDAVRLRYRSRPVPCRLDGDSIELGEPVDGAAPGQIAVLYRGDTVVGHGVITR